MDRIKQQPHQEQEQAKKKSFYSSAIYTYFLQLLGVQWLNVPHHHRLQQVDECTVTTSLFQEGSAHCLLLRLLHQQVQVTHILHGTVQLRAQVTAAWARQRVQRDTEERREGGVKEDRGEAGEG